MRNTLGTWVLGYFVIAASAACAAPLDDQMKAFDEAKTQTEAAVTKLLQTGLKERRSAEAYAVVRPWLNANPSSSQALLFHAAQAAEYGGEWSEAVSFYRKLLKGQSIDSGFAGEAVSATYRLLLNGLGDTESAYLFMREDGGRLRGYGRARQYDHWFFEQAVARGDVAALAKRLAAIHANPNENPADYAAYMRKLFEQLETFAERDAATVEALDKLARVATRDPGFKPRWDWINAVSRYNVEAQKNNIKSVKPDEALLVEPLKAAKALMAADPIGGAQLIVKGWSQWNQGDTPTFFRYVHVHRDLKAQVFVEALQRLSPAQAKNLLEVSASGPRGRRVTVASFISPQNAWVVVPRFPTIFNAISAPPVELWEKGLTVADAKALAPHIVRNPHPHAAIVRAYAAAGTNDFGVIGAAMKQSEMWRFTDPKATVQMVYKSGAVSLESFRANEAAVSKAFAEPNATQERLRKQVAKEADSRTRMAAFNAIYQELRGNPSTPGILGLWDAVLKQAPVADAEQMMMKLSSDFHASPADRRELQRYLLERAVGMAEFGNGYAKMQVRPVMRSHSFGTNWVRYGKSDLRKNTQGLATHLGGLLKKQMQAGTLLEPILGMWLSCVDPKKPESLALIQEVAKSPAYAKVAPTYHEVAAHAELFGTAALTEQSATDPRFVSRELLALPAEATSAQVEAAFKAVHARLSKATEPIGLLGLQPVAALPTLNASVRAQALSLFRDHSPIGAYPVKQGYEALLVRLVEDFEKEGQWGAIEPYVLGFWRCAATPDSERHNHGADALSRFSEKALENGAASPALSVVRGGFRNPASRDLLAQTNWNRAEIAGRLRGVSSKAGVAIGATEIPVDETHPAYAIYKSNAEFVQGNLESAWALYDANADLLVARVDRETAPLLQKLPVDYGFWLLQRTIQENEAERGEDLVKELTIWSRQAEGTFSIEQEAELKIAYANLAFRKGALPTSRAWYRKVADAAEYKGSEMQLRAALGSVHVDRVSKNFSAALTELDQLMRLKNPEYRMRVHYARAEVLRDQENFAEAFEELTAVLRHDPNHADAMILRGKIQFEMRKLIEASQIELGVTQEHKIIVPGETLKINLHDPTLSVSGVGVDIEVEVWAKSGDRERVMLHQLGDNKEKFRAEVPTSLAAPVAGDKVLQVLGEDEIRYGYSKRFREKMDDLPPDPELVIGIASDAQLAFSAGAFPPRTGERRLNIDELGLTTAQAALGTRTVRPGNPVYIRVIDADQGKTPGIDELVVTLRSSSGDEIRRLSLKETGPYTGEFEAVVPTAGAQALAFASESAPGRDPNMTISSQAYPGWLGNVGKKEEARTFGVDLNDRVDPARMVISGEAGQELTHFVLQTSMNGNEWTTRARYPEEGSPWDGRPTVSSFPTHKGGIAVSVPEGRELPVDWLEKMELLSARASCGYLAEQVTGLSVEKLPVVSTGHPNYPGLVRYRALFYQPAAAIRRFKLSGYPATDDKGNVNTIFLLDGRPADVDSDDPLTIERELAPGLHEIQIWRHEGRDQLLKRKPVLSCDVSGQAELIPCPDAMFDPATFPAALRKEIPTPAKITRPTAGSFEVAFGEETQARLVRLVIIGFEGVAPMVKSVTLEDRAGKAWLPVAKDFMALRENDQLEVLPGDQVTVWYEDAVVATPRRNRHEGRLNVAYNTATLSASFLNYVTTKEGRQLVLEPIRRFRLDDAVALVVDDPDMDGGPERDTIEIRVTSSGGAETVVKAVETEAHSGRFIGRVFPVAGAPARDSEIQVGAGGTLTARYRDEENLDPGIPTDRSVVIQHAQYTDPQVGLYTVTSEWLPPRPPSEKEGETDEKKNVPGPEVVLPRRALSYTYLNEKDGLAAPIKGVIGAGLRFDVVVPHLALAGSSQINAYVQVVPADSEAGTGFDVKLPGTLKLKGALQSVGLTPPQGYTLKAGPQPPTNQPPLEEGRFSFSVPLILGDPPLRSFATKAADELPSSVIPDGVAVRAGDTVRIGYPYKDEQGAVQWKIALVEVGSHAFLDVMSNGYSEALTRAFVGEKVYVRVLAPGLDRGPERDRTSVSLKAGSGAATRLELRETEGHSGLFKGVFRLSYAEGDVSGDLPPVELNGLPVRYGDELVVSYAASGEDPAQSGTVRVNKGADGRVEPFSKRFTGDEMAVKTGFTLAECWFELAKKHREMGQESLSRREMGHARKLLAEALATHRDDELRAHAEYLLGNLSQEYADLSKNEEAKLPMYQDALARFSKIPVDYPETEFASKAQFKTALVYEKMGETEISVEEYVKLAYKYPDDELIPTVMSRLGSYFQKKGLAFKQQADPLREKEDAASKAEVLRIDGLSYPEFLNAAMIFSKLQERFPDDALAGLSGLRSAQNYMRAHRYEDAIAGFEKVFDNEQYDGRDIRAQAMYWSGLSHERIPTAPKMMEAYQLYRRVTFDFPDSKWAKYARGRLADPAFARIIELENLERERMLEQLKILQRAK